MGSWIDFGKVDFLTKNHHFSPVSRSPALINFEIFHEGGFMDFRKLTFAIRHLRGSYFLQKMRRPHKPPLWRRFHDLRARLLRLTDFILKIADRQTDGRFFIGRRH